MNGTEHTVASRADRIKRGLIVWCAMLLLVKGVWLLIEPTKAHGAEKVDNVFATGTLRMASVVVNR